MLRVVLVRCPRCGKIFRKTKGGFVKGIDDDNNLCTGCKVKTLKNIFRK